MTFGNWGLKSDDVVAAGTTKSPDTTADLLFNDLKLIDLTEGEHLYLYLAEDVPTWHLGQRVRVPVELLFCASHVEWSVAVLHLFIGNYSKSQLFVYDNDVAATKPFFFSFPSGCSSSCFFKAE